VGVVLVTSILYCGYCFIGYLLLPIMLLRFFFKGLTTPAYGKRIGERLGFVDIIPEGIIWVHSNFRF
jgi:3-deoxy-D-manno-octulosonic-acid transferase